MAALLLVGLIWRLVVLFSPLGELDADEAVVGLMARHIAFLGERPVFYWGQPYLGSLEAFSAAPLFRLFDSSALVLKLVPIAYSLGFLGLSGLLARRLFGDGPALATAAYLALPPAMWAVWSTKARGGYAELLFLGEALLLVTLWWAAAPETRARRGALLWGLLAGLSVWTHLLAVVYVLPCVVYLALARRVRVFGLGLAMLGTGVGLLPLLIDNLLGGFSTLRALLQPPDLPLDPPAQLLRFFRVGLPVLAGLGQPTTSAAMFDADWLNRPAGHLSVALAFLALLGLALAAHRRSVADLVHLAFRSPASHPSVHQWEGLAAGDPASAHSERLAGERPPDSQRQEMAAERSAPAHWDDLAAERLADGQLKERDAEQSAEGQREGLASLGELRSAEPALLLLVAVCVPPVVALTRFGFFVSEPRYALPLYAAIPLVMAAIWRLPAVWRLATLAGLLVLNGWSLASTDARLWRPEDALDSTAATRADLVRYLVSQDRHQMYTDYWIGYPIMFETHETVLAYVISGGFNRYLPPADNVQRTPNAAWVFERDAPAAEPSPGVELEADFLAQLQAVGGQAHVQAVSVYRVYTDVEPIDALRPPR